MDKHQKKPTDELPRPKRDNLPEALDPGLFGVPDHRATDVYGADLARIMIPTWDAEEAQKNFLRGLEIQQEVLGAWLRLWQPTVDAMASLSVPRDPKPIDFFISHAKRDENEVKQFRERLEELEDFSSYVDWIDDKKLERSKASEKTAETLRNRMRQSKALLLLLSENSAASQWVQWEVGFFDALRGHVFVVPLSPEARKAIARQEYLSLYPMLSTPEEVIQMLRENIRTDAK